MKKTGDTSYIYKNEHDMAYGDFKDLKRRTYSVESLRDKAFNIVKNPNFDGFQRGLASMVYKVFDKKSTGSGVNISLVFNEQLAKELYKLIIRKFKKGQFIQNLKIIFWVLI